MNEFSLAMLGDGVWANWGEQLEELRGELTRLYTHSTFEIANHGQIGSRLGHVLWRVTNDDGARKSLSFHNPHVVVVESCASTQFWDGPEGMSEYRDLLRRVWDEIERTTTAKALFCLAPAPPRDRFLEGAPLFVGTSKATRGRFADNLKMFVEEARAIAEDEGWPVADVDLEFSRRVKEGESARRFFDQSDGVHPSRYGYALISRVVVREIDNHRFIEEKIVK